MEPGDVLGANPRGSVWWVNVGAAIGCAWAVRPTLGTEPAAPARHVPAVGNLLSLPEPTKGDRNLVHLRG